MTDSPAQEAEAPAPSSELLEAIGGGPTEFPVLAPTTFKPWHRPRKQFVREKQWLQQIKRLVNDLGLAGSELRYLTLPGEDLLDLRHVHDHVCEPGKIKLRYVGFNTGLGRASAAETTLNSSAFALHRLPYVDPDSPVHGEDVRLVGKEKTVSWLRLRDERPFHAVNLDLCGGFAGDETEALPNYFLTLDWLLKNQATATHDSLLFITTRTDDQSVSAAARGRLLELVTDVAKDCAAYVDAIREHWGPEALDDSLPLSDRFHPDELFMLGLTQWIVNRAAMHGLKTGVRSFMSYRVFGGSDADDIVSLAVRFSPDPKLPADHTGLLGAANHNDPATKKAADESHCRQSAQAPGRIHKRVHVDRALAEDGQLLEQCVEGAATLLESSGYDAKAYREWALNDLQPA